VRLIVISPEAEDARELAVLAELFSAGLTHYHLRKPAWSRAQLAAWLQALPEALHARIVLHTHHDLAAEFAVGGLHYRDQPFQQECNLMGETFRLSVRLRSRAVHTLSTLRDSLGVLADLESVLALPRRAEVMALGGIDAERIPACHDYGFDGVAVLGAVWQDSDPVHAFKQLNHACRYAHAA
jgi:thiamine-phosphate pyrophosphorylase